MPSYYKKYLQQSQKKKEKNALHIFLVSLNYKCKENLLLNTNVTKLIFLLLHLTNQEENSFTTIQDNVCPL